MCTVKKLILSYGYYLYRYFYKLKKIYKCKLSNAKQVLERLLSCFRHAKNKDSLNSGARFIMRNHNENASFNCVKIGCGLGNVCGAELENV